MAVMAGGVRRNAIIRMMVVADGCSIRILTPMVMADRGLLGAG